jgi:hypothetical protein
MSMYRIVILSACLILLPAFGVMAQDGGQEKNKQAPSEAKELSGMSIVGNDEAPKSLYIVPWKSSELGDETSLNMLLDGNAAPVDREVFVRQLAYYRVSTEQASRRP